MDLTKNEASNATFTCQTTGEPVPVVNWYYNGALVDNDANDNKYNIMQSSFNATTIIVYMNTLTIMNVESSDVGTYTCNATNVISSDTSSGILTVNGEF